ncbi:hypothetical protein AXG93_2789s1030 [Marchantia polymorpha subsp. ruderalis]|uniref:Uncharacterized protein n=1 Tax=Marchantia polymorpha subsp. ruderalis TaxID=1480154 RepID=A0A176W948_MARPO|nr:hypothetical protein AXG93_2789s1030 [Marchantia polymorpha subsp. ruderalis]
MISILFVLRADITCIRTYGWLERNKESVVLAFGDKILTSKPRVLHEVKARQTYKQGASPVLNARYLATLRQSRTLLVKEFVQNFLQSHDERLEKGRTDEQDILLNFIKEKTTLSVMPPNVTSSSESPNDNKFEMDGKDALPPFGRLHCWVMVVAGKRDVTESFFLEPTTGFRYSLKHSPYQYIELVFSPSNVWINVQHKHYSSTGGMNTVSFDFHDSAAWEKLFASDQMRRMKTSEDEESSVNSRILNIMHNTSKPAETGLTVAVLASDETHDILDEKKSMSQSEDLHNNIKTSAVANEATRNYHWILPLSWVPRLLIPMQAFVTRFPNGAKRTFYDRCEHLLFAFYGDYMRYDGLVERVMLFADVERTQLVECHDYFQRRKDKLIKRHYIINDNKVSFSFSS